MPRTYLTQAQREAALIDRMRETLTDGILIQKAKERLTNEQIGNGLEIGERTISKIINGNDVKLSLTQTMRLLQFAGFQLKRRDNLD